MPRADRDSATDADDSGAPGGARHHSCALVAGQAPHVSSAPSMVVHASCDRIKTVGAHGGSRRRRRRAPGKASQESRVAAYRQGELPRDGAPRQETLDAVVVRLVAECAPDDAGARSMVDRRQAPTWEGLRLLALAHIPC